jgi:hypothetical protein
MTVAVSVKVQDGIVLATDSASTLYDESGAVANVYNSADKIVNLRKGLPLGIMFWGTGGIGDLGISTLAKDLRTRLSGDDADHADWTVNPTDYTLEEVAERAREFLFDENYSTAFADLDEKPELGFLVAGYSSAATLSESWEISIDSHGECGPPTLSQGPEMFGQVWRGQIEPITRLLVGASPFAAGAFMQFGLTEEQAWDIWQSVRETTEVNLWHPAMPIQDVIDLADFLVEMSKQFYRFLPVDATVGGPTEIAAITKHEGFKWVRRKHYFDAKYIRTETTP